MSARSTRLASSLALAALACAAWGTATASAQVIVLRIDPAAEPVCATLEQSLGQWGLAQDPGYFAEAQRLGLDPASDEALAQLTPPLQVQLAVVPSGQEGDQVVVELRDGTSGQRLGELELLLHRGVLSAESEAALNAAVGQRLGVQPAEGAGAPDEAQSEQSYLETHLQFHVFGGVGFGTLALDLPAPGETLSVDLGAFPAFEVGLGVQLAVSPGFAIGPELVYQTSLNHEVDEPHLAGATDTLRIRAHRFDGVLRAVFAFGADRGFRIALGLGYAVRNLRPEVHHLLTPNYTLAGPLARISVRIPFGDLLALRLAPEAQFIVVGDELETLGTHATGFSLGGEVGVEIAVSEQFAVELAFRDAHAWIGSTFGSDSLEVGRFGTARLVWQP